MRPRRHGRALRHPEVYDSLGSPSLILNNTVRNNRLVLAWLWNEDYSDLGDPETVQRANLVRRFLVTLLINFGSLIGVYLLAMFAAASRHAV